MDAIDDPRSELPDDLVRFLAKVPREDWKKVEVILVDSTDAREMVNLTLLVKLIHRRAPQAVVRGRVTSGELVAGMARIRDALRTLRGTCEDFARKARIQELYPEIRAREYPDPAERQGGGSHETGGRHEART